MRGERGPMPRTPFLPDLAFFFFFFFFSLMRRKSFCLGFSLSLSLTDPGDRQVARVKPRGVKSEHNDVMFSLSCRVILTDVKATPVRVRLMASVPVQLVLLALLPQQRPLLVALGVDCGRCGCTPACCSLHLATGSRGGPGV